MRPFVNHAGPEPLHLSNDDLSTTLRSWTVLNFSTVTTAHCLRSSDVDLMIGSDVLVYRMVRQLISEPAYLTGI